MPQLRRTQCTSSCPPRIQFKGSGWYITDYAKKATGRGQERRRLEATKAGDKGEKAADGTKSAPTTESSIDVDELGRLEHAEDHLTQPARHRP